MNTVHYGKNEEHLDSVVYHAALISHFHDGYLFEQSPRKQKLTGLSNDEIGMKPYTLIFKGNQFNFH
jgi:hypothetical protein